jgi:CheY-like chemotaxis protein
MKCKEFRCRRDMAEPMVTLLRQRPAEKSASTVTAQAGSQHEPTFRQAIVTLSGHSRGLGRVLVVDDDDVIRRLIAANLTLEGFDVATAVDGQDCLEKVSVIAPDVITLDAMMPRLDGWETVRRLRKRPDTTHIKVVLITARDQNANPARYRHARADAYLAKPFDPAEMIRVVRELAGPAGMTARGS